ncbi:MAG: hypothetical protein OSJ27_08865 [Candidatus Gastranaerophilales bacterium]|nr:hypothetical protein [Candidatus Gastranaerophilales bacterium]
MTLFKSYTREQRTMKDKGFTLCIECKKGFRGDKTCGANGHADYNNESANGCNCGEEIEKTKQLASNSEELSHFMTKALKPHSKLMDINICITGQSIINLEPLFNGFKDTSCCPKAAINSYIEANLPDFELELTEFVQKLKTKGILIVGVKGTQKEFDPFAEAIELVKKRLI